MPTLRPWLPVAVLATLALAGCEQPAATTAPADPAATAAPATAPAAAAAPAPRAGLTREGVQTVTLDLRNATDTPIVSLSAVTDGRPGANLLPAGMAIPAGGTYALPVAVGTYLIRAELQAPGPFTPARAILRHVIVPRFPPNPAPRMPVTLR